jgi:hypothetical protein
MLQNARFISQNELLSFTQQDMPYFRRNTCLEIMSVQAVEIVDLVGMDVDVDRVEMDEVDADADMHTDDGLVGAAVPAAEAKAPAEAAAEAAGLAAAAAAGAAAAVAAAAGTAAVAAQMAQLQEQRQRRATRVAQLAAEMAQLAAEMAQLQAEQDAGDELMTELGAHEN